MTSTVMIAATDEHETMLQDCAKRSGRLDSWETSFVESLQRQIANGRHLTEKQIQTLDLVWEKATARG